MAPRLETLARALGLLGGLAIAATMVAAWWVPASRASLGADAVLSAAPPGELTLKPLGRFLSASGLRPGGAPGRGSLLVRSQVERPVAVSVRVQGADDEMRRRLWVELRARGRVLARGPLGSLGRFGRRSFSLGPREAARLEARVFLPDATQGHEGRIAQATVGFRARFTGGPR